MRRTRISSTFMERKRFSLFQPVLRLLKKKTTYREWIESRFGAQDVEEIDLEPGHAIEGIWRPSLYSWADTQKAIKVNPTEQRSQEQALRILVEALDELLLFIEPSDDGLNSYSHKTRDLLILACTESENQMRALLNKANWTAQNGRFFTTQDYVKLNLVAQLYDFQISLRYYENFSPSKPFANWDDNNPTQSLPWYHAYNQTKHNRDEHFAEAKLRHTIDAVASNIVLYCRRFSPLILLNDTNTLSGLINQLFEIKMVESDRKSFYLPKLKFSPNTRKDCFVYDSYKAGHKQPWITDPLVL